MKEPRLNKLFGFTLIELMVTLAIVAILVTVAAPVAEVATQRSKEQALRTALRDIREAIDAYKRAVDEGKVAKSADETGYPKNLDVLVNGVVNIKDPKKGKLYFLRRLPRDPMGSDEAITAQKTWGTRSYNSPPGEPKEGDDVYDIYSLSRAKGLNGIPYHEW